MKNLENYILAINSYYSLSFVKNKVDRESLVGGQERKLSKIQHCCENRFFSIFVHLLVAVCLMKMHLFTAHCI